MASKQICKTHGDVMSACSNLHTREMYCDGQGSQPRFKGQSYGECVACGKMIRLRADGTIRAHNGKGR